MNSDGLHAEGLIVLHDDGTLYTNQTAGVLCNHPTARGYLHPMPVPEAIKDICYDSVFLDPSQLDACDAALRDLGLPMRVDRQGRNEEAWLSVDLGLGRYESTRGILAWENSD